MPIEGDVPDQLELNLMDKDPIIRLEAFKELS